MLLAIALLTGALGPSCGLNPLSSSPLAVSCQCQTDEDVPVQVVLQASPADANPKFLITARPRNGSLDVPIGVPFASPAITYVPVAGFVGDDAFTFMACDDSESASESAAQAATVTIQVKPKGAPKTDSLRLPGSLSVSPPDDLNASGDPGGPFSPAQITYTLTNTGDRPLDWTAALAQGWSTLSKSSGTLAAGASDVVTVSISQTANHLPTGKHSNAITFVNTASHAGDTARAVNVTVAPPPPGALTVSPYCDLTSTGHAGGRFLPADVSYVLANTGSQPITWTAASPQNWITLSATTGTLAAGARATITATLNDKAATLPVANYSGAVEFTNATNGAGDTTRLIHLTVTPRPPGVLSVSPEDDWTSAGLLGGPFPNANVTYILINTGELPLIWSVTQNQAWLSLSKQRGALEPGAVDCVIVSINEQADSLAEGNYNATISFADLTGDSAPITRVVALQVLDVGNLGVSPESGLSSSGHPGGPFSPESAVYTVKNIGTQPIKWTAGTTCPWLVLTKGSGTLLPGASDTVTVSIGGTANSLPSRCGHPYTGTVTFRNATSGWGTTVKTMSLSVCGKPASRFHSCRPPALAP